MQIRSLAAIAALGMCVQAAGAQAQNPVSTAFRVDAKEMSKNLVAAAELMPADKFVFKPTPAQMSWADIMVHLAQGNDALCSAVGGMPAPKREKVAATADKAALVARLRETFQFCDQAIAKVDDSKLGEEVTFFGEKGTRAGAMIDAAGDWGDHYSQLSIYLRLNGLLPPTAKKP